MDFSTKKLAYERKKAGLSHGQVQEAAKKNGVRGLDQSSVSQKENGKIPVSIADMRFLAELYTGKKDISIFFDFTGNERICAETRSEMEADKEKWLDRYANLVDDYEDLRQDYKKALKILDELEGLEGKELSGLRRA